MFRPDILIIFTLVHGGVYALLAVGFSLIFGVARLINLTHTAFYMLAAYVLWYLTRELGLGVVASIVITVVGISLLGILSYKLFIDRIREHASAVLLVTIALALFFEQLIYALFQGHIRTIQSFIPGYSVIWGIKVLNQYLVSLGIAAVIIVIVWLLLSKTKMGITIRAVANDAEIASLMGISISRTLLITMGIATALAAIAGVIIAPSQAITPTIWTPPLTMIMVIVILGGLGSIKGSIIGAFIIAFVEQLVSLSFSGGGYLSITFVMLAMVIVLVVRPGGLFGTIFEEERL